MSKPIILITGGSGLLALNWAAAVAETFDVVLLLHDRVVRPSFARTLFVDLSSPDGISRALDEMEPLLVVHAAGLTNVEACEKDPELATRTNVHIARDLAGACAARGTKMVSISTDHLFDGSTSFLDENAQVSPLNVYGRTKADGEKAALDANGSTVVVRTNFFCWGPRYRPSFSDMIIGNLRAGTEVSLFTDVFFTPILAQNLIDIVHRLVDRSAAGIFNIVGDERLSKFAFGKKVAAQFMLDDTLIRESQLSERTNLVQRPLDMSLSNAKVRNLLGETLGNVDLYLQHMAALEGKAQIGELQQL
ncbi:MAG: SDR family oxidoreductase [Rhodobacteraceae bacterium]|nr:SDR family oxidoreductase [Paracoccaceae bacterium]